MRSELKFLFAALLLPLAGHGADPAPAWTGGVDLRLREVGINNANALDDASASAERHFQRYRARAWGQYQPEPALAVNARLMWEGRHYHEPDTPPPVSRSGTAARSCSTTSTSRPTSRADCR
jgi:hypothetical protein